MLFTGIVVVRYWQWWS